MRGFKLLCLLLIAGLISPLLVSGPASARVISPFESAATPMLPGDESPAIRGRAAAQALAPGDLVDFDAALIAGADYLKHMQADVTDDNAGNGTNGVDETPNDPDDAGWDWSVTSPPAPFFHTTAASPTNIYGATAQGLYYAYLETGDATYFTALKDFADKAVAAGAGVIRTGSDMKVLLLFNDLYSTVVGPTTVYADAAKAKYDARVAVYGSATALAQYIRDVRNSQGYPNGIIGWDIGVYAVVAQKLYAVYGGTYDQDADAIAEVLWQDSFNDNPGYFDVVDDAGWDPTWTDKNFWWYTLGISGLLDAFAASGAHADELPGLVQRILDSQYGGGGISGSYGANPDDEDWQSTGYCAMSLGNYDKATYQDPINRMGYWIGATQHTSGGWLYSSGAHYPETCGEVTGALYFTTNDLTTVLVDDDFVSQAAVDAYNDANGTNYTWGYDAFQYIQDGVDAVSGSTVYINPGVYEEQVIIAADIDVIGSGVGVTTIQSPVDMAVSFGGTPNYPIVMIQSTGNATISDLTIDGLGRGNLNYRFVGVGFNDAGGGIYNCEILNIMDTPFSGAQHGVAVYSWNDDGTPRTITVEGCLIEGFQKNAMALNSDAGSPLTVAVIGNTVNGAGATTVTAQNGIQVYCNTATGTIEGNTITGIAYDNTSATTKWVATSILNYYADLNIIGNTITGAHLGVYNIDGASTIAENDLTIEKIGVFAYGIVATDPPNAVPSPVDAELIGTVRDGAARQAAALLTVDVSRNTVNFSGGDNTATTGIEADAGYATDNLAVTANENFVNGFEVGLGFWVCESSCSAGVFTGVTAQSNSLVDNTYGVYTNVGYLTVQASTNWFGLTDPATVNAMVGGAVDYTPYLGLGDDADPGTPGFQATLTDFWVDDNSAQIGSVARIQEAINIAPSTTVNVAAGLYPENVLANKPVALLGQPGAEIVPAGGTGVDVSADDVTVQGFAIHNVSSGINVYLNKTDYTANFGYSNLHLLDNTIYAVSNGAWGFGIYIGTESERYNPADPIGIYDAGLTDLLDFTGLVVSGNEIYGCSGASVVLQSIRTYGAELLEISDNYVHNGAASGIWVDGAWDLNITGNRFIADNYGLFFSNYGDGYYETIHNRAFDPKNIFVTGNALTGNTTVGVAVWDGYPAEMEFHHNVISGNPTGFSNYLVGDVDAEYNYWGTWDGPSDPNGVDEALIGTCFPPATMKNTVAELGGGLGNPVTSNVDYCPWTSSGVQFSTNNIVHYCPGALTFDVMVTEAVQLLEGANIAIEFPAALAFAGAAVADGNYQLLPISQSADGIGYDTVYIPFIVKTGWLNGPATMYTVTMTANDNICAGDLISMIAADLRDTANASIPTALPLPIAVVVDCADPVFATSTADGGFYNVPPVLAISATDDCDLDGLWYQIDGCGSWTAIATGLTGTTFTSGWVLPAGDFAALSEAAHCLRFKVRDDAGRVNADSCTFTWCFTKDMTVPPPPTNLTAAPGHNKVKLAWTNAATDFDHTVIMRTDWNGSGNGYPQYGSLNGAAEGPYPTDTAAGDYVVATTDAAYIDVLDLSNATRDIYHYAAFTVDAAGNVSAPATARSTSYWLGDVSGAGGVGDYDGYVFAEDLNPLTIVYGSAEGDANFSPLLDFGPTIPGGAKDIPVPDDSVNFEDGILFAINFDIVNPLMKVRPLFDDRSVSGPLAVTLTPVEGGYTLALVNNGGEVKGLHVVVSFDPQATFGGAMLSEAVRAFDQPYLAKTIAADDHVTFDFIVMGEDRTIIGSGALATLTFAAPEGTNPVVSLTEVTLRDRTNAPVGALAIVEPASGTLPESFALAQNFPNPFNPSTSIEYSLPVGGHVRLEVFNLLGQHVRTLVDRFEEAGVYTATWNGRDETGASVASGVYLYRITAGSFNETRKMMLLK